MKQIKKVSKIPLFGFIAIAAIIVFSFTALTACGEDPNEAVTPTPVAADFDIGNLTQTAGSVAAVTITPKTGKSTGTVTVYYEGTDTTTYAKSTSVPTAAGTYAVTFDVAAAKGWKAASGLSAGTLTIAAVKQTVAKPTATPQAGEAAAGTSITLAAATADAEIWYTTDDSVPAKNRTGSAKYTAPFAITPPVTVKAIAVKEGMNDSEILEAAYTLHEHQWGEWTVTTSATCTAAGEETRTCVLDPTHTEPRPVAALGHDWGDWTQTTAPTCTEAGEETRTCKHDATHTEPRPIAALGHDYQWVETTPAAWTSAGVESGTCSHDASHTTTRPIPSLSAALMVAVPGGSFEMGKDLGTAATGDVTPVHTVTLTGFSIGKYEVTQAQYQAVMGSNPSIGSSNPASGEVQENRPVEMVSWYDALVFCNKLSRAEGLTPAYSINNSTDPADWGTVPTSTNATWNAVTIVSNATGYRLPTEAQWEYAAKGGDPTASGWVGYTYSGSDTLDEVAWHYGNAGSKSHEVGKKAPNKLGLYDMSGNVFEWCWDWHGSYTSEAQTDPAGAASGSNRVDRGGSWYSSASVARSVNRDPSGPDYRHSRYGFRLVRP